MRHMHPVEIKISQTYKPHAPSPHPLVATKLNPPVCCFRRAQPVMGLSLVSARLYPATGRCWAAAARKPTLPAGLGGQCLQQEVEEGGLPLQHGDKCGRCVWKLTNTQRQKQYFSRDGLTKGLQGVKSGDSSMFDEANLLPGSPQGCSDSQEQCFK